MKIFIATVLVLVPFCAFAEPLQLPRPDRDFDQDCRNFERKDGDKRPAAELYNECFDQIQGLYNKVKEMWANLTEEEQRECLRVMDPSNPIKLNPWGKFAACVFIQTKIAKEEDPGRAVRRKAEQERQEREQRDKQERQALERRDKEERPLIPKRGFQY